MMKTSVSTPHLGEARKSHATYEFNASIDHETAGGPMDITVTGIPVGSRAVILDLQAHEEMRAELIDAKDRIDDLEGSIPQWISVEDRLPEAGQRVWAYGGCDEFGWQASVAYLDSLKDGSQFWHDDPEYDTFNDTVTHWMPLPDPPEVSS